MNQTGPTDSVEQETQRKKGKRIWIILGAVLGSIAVLCVGMFLFLKVTGILQIDNRAGSIYIRDVYLTLDPDASRPEQSENREFPSSAERIYLVVFVEAPDPIYLGVRWYREGELLLEDGTKFKGGIAWYLEPQPGEDFPPGMYRAEVFLIEDPLRTIDFRVVER